MGWEIGLAGLSGWGGGGRWEGGKGEGTEEARRAREMVCCARVMVGGGYGV